MIEVKVKTIWRRQVAIRDRFVKEAVQRKEGILFIHKGERMPIPFNRLKESIVGKSDRRFVDQLGRDNPHYLIYFKWQPIGKQERLC